MFTWLRKSFRFYSLSLFAYDAITAIIGIVVWLIKTAITIPFKRDYSGFDIAVVYILLFHYNLRVFSWKFWGWWTLCFAISYAMTKITEQLWNENA